MFKRFCLITLAFVALPIAAQLVTAPPQDRLKLAIHLSKRGMHGDALREFEAIRDAKEVPHDEVLFRLGDTYRVLKRTDDALNCYAELISSTPSSRYADVARLNRAMLRAGEERARELKELDRKSAPVAIRSTALNYLGDIAREAKKNAEAVDYYVRAAVISPSNEVGRLANLKCAALLSESKELDDRFRALKIYLVMAELDEPALAAEALAIASPLRGPANEDAYYITASSLRMLERRADAIHAYAAQLQAFPKGRYADEAWFDYLTIVAAHGDNAGVLSMLEDRDEPPAKYAERAWGLGCESAITLTNYPVAVRYAKRVVEKNGGNAPAAVHRLAWLLEQTHDWGNAARAYRGLAGRWPGNKLAPQALFLAGTSEMKRGQAELACNDWKSLVAKYPDSPYASDALYARAMVVLRRPDKTVQDYRAAEQLLGERMARFPKASRRMENLYWWGVAAHGSGDEPEAEKHLRAALAEKPSAVYEREIKLELASVLKKRGVDLEAAEMLVSLLGTKAADRITPELLEWTARTLMDAQKWKEALAAAGVLERRQVDPAWTQTAATLVGQTHEKLGERDAAKEAYARALATGSETESGAQAALALGRLESLGGLFDEARAHLENAVTRAQSQEQLSLRIQAYAALAANEEERGAMDKALGYYMLVGSLFDDARMVPHALSRAAAILKEMGREKESADVTAELRRRFPDAPEAK